MSKYVYGIDLGTTYSCIAYADEHGKAVVVKNFDSQSTTPSVVQFPPDGGVVVGQPAKDMAVMLPDDTISLVKSIIGKNPIAYENKNGEKLSPAEVSAHILRELANQAGQAMDDEVKDVVITCPAYFGETEREATKQAGELAGLNVLALLEEPTAAAIYYGATRGEEDKTVLVYDLGGGTFDISIIHILAGEIRPVTTEGDHNLGGKNWDTEISKYLMQQFAAQTQYDGEYDAEFLQDLAIKTERAKIQLTNRPDAKVALSMGTARAAVELTREKFDELTIPSLLNNTLTLMDKAIQTAKEKNFDTIDEVLLVGGSTIMPQVAKAVQEHLGIEPKLMEPNEAVAKGAALFAIIRLNEGVEIINKEENIDTGEVIETIKDKETGEVSQRTRLLGGSAMPTGMDDVRVVSISTKSFGIRAFDTGMNKYQIFNLIKKDDTLPHVGADTFGTREANQETVSLEVYESPLKEDNYDVDSEFLKGEAVLQLPPNTPAGADIKVMMELGLDGTLVVTGCNVATGDECRGEFVSDCVLNAEEMEKAAARMHDLIR